MSQVVDLSGKPVEKEIPRDDTPEAVLKDALEDMRLGNLPASHLVIVMQLRLPDGQVKYCLRSSQMNNADCITLLAVATRLELDDLLST